MKFGTLWNPKKCYNDNEVNNGVSMTDETGYESLETILAKCMRGIPVRSFVPMYELDGPATDEDFDNFPGEDGDYDIVDAAGLSLRDSGEDSRRSRLDVRHDCSPIDRTQKVQTDEQDSQGRPAASDSAG